MSTASRCSCSNLLKGWSLRESRGGSRKGWPLQSKTFNTRKEAESWARRTETDIDRGAFVPMGEAETLSLAVAIDRYMVERLPQLRGAAQAKYRLEALKQTTSARLPMARVRPADVADYRDERAREGASPNTIRLELAALSSVFEHARLEWSLPIQNPVRSIRKPAPGKARDRRLQRGEEKRLFDAINASRCPALLPFVTLALETACRRSELLTARWEDINTQRGTMVLRDTKNGETRIVPLSQRARKVLKGLGRPRGGIGPIMPVKPGTITAAFRRACERAKLDDFHLHDLRHEAVSRLFERHLDVMEVAAVSGHKTLSMLKRYTHLHAEKLAKKLG